MKQTEKGILLSRSSYSETSLIITVLTELSGIQTFLFQGAKRKKGTLLFPLAPIEFSYYRRQDSAMGKMTDLNLAASVHDLPFNPVKSSICFFLVEVVQKTQRQGHTETALFHFLWEEALWLNHSDEWANYPCWFLAAYSRFCGITPSVEQPHPTVFDFNGGRLSSVRPNHVEYFESGSIHWFENMLNDEKPVFLALQIPKEDRAACLDLWLNYYRHHLNGMQQLKSLEVIRTVLQA
jgi:DNA repair protein RecO (recombination protein O)